MNVMREMKDIRKEQNELLEMKNILPKVTNTLDGLTFR